MNNVFLLAIYLFFTYRCEQCFNSDDIKRKLYVGIYSQMWEYHLTPSLFVVFSLHLLSLAVLCNNAQTKKTTIQFFYLRSYLILLPIAVPWEDQTCLIHFRKSWHISKRFSIGLGHLNYVKYLDFFFSLIIWRIFMHILNVENKWRTSQGQTDVNSCFFGRNIPKTINKGEDENRNFF